MPPAGCRLIHRRSPRIDPAVLGAAVVGTCAPASAFQVRIRHAVRIVQVLGKPDLRTDSDRLVVFSAVGDGIHNDSARIVNPPDRRLAEVIRNVPGRITRRKLIANLPEVD